MADDEKILFHYLMIRDGELKLGAMYKPIDYVRKLNIFKSSDLAGMTRAGMFDSEKHLIKFLQTNPKFILDLYNRSGTTTDLLTTVIENEREGVSDVIKLLFRKKILSLKEIGETNLRRLAGRLFARGSRILDVLIEAGLDLSYFDLTIADANDIHLDRLFNSVALHRPDEFKKLFRYDELTGAVLTRFITNAMVLDDNPDDHNYIFRMMDRRPGFFTEEVYPAFIVLGNEERRELLSIYELIILNVANDFYQDLEGEEELNHDAENSRIYKLLTDKLGHTIDINFLVGLLDIPDPQDKQDIIDTIKESLHYEDTELKPAKNK